MSRTDLHFARRGPKMVWVLTLAAIFIAGGGLAATRVLMARAYREREAALSVHTQALSITNKFFNQVDGFDRSLTKMIETDEVAELALNESEDLNATLGPLFSQLTEDPTSFSTLNAIHQQYFIKVDALLGDAAVLRQWHVDRQNANKRRDADEKAVKDQIQKMRAKIASCLGHERLRRIGLLSAYRKAAESEKLALANGLFNQSDNVATLTPIERELADLLVVIEQLLAAEHADVARDLVNNQLAQSLHRLHHLISANSSHADSSAPTEEDLRILVAQLLGSAGRLDVDSQSIVRDPGSGLLTSVESQCNLLARTNDYRTTIRADIKAARAVLVEFADSADRSTSTFVAQTNARSVRAWSLIGLVTASGAIIILSLGAIIARSIRRQARDLEAVNAELDKASMLAAAASQAKSDFLANMSHEIRTPMTAILGYTDLLGDSSLSDAEKSDHVRTIRRNGDHLLGIINDILDLSKIEAGKMTLESIDTGVVQIAEEVISLMRPRAIAKGLSIEATLAFPLPQVIKTDPLRLRQILVNLTGNAVKFTQNGGIRLHISHQPGVVRFEVIDTGIGLTKEQSERLFKPFTQADETMSRRFGGTGLGLAISHRLVSLMGGDIQVSSQAGVGTTFWFTIPTGEIDSSLMLTQAPVERSAVRQTSLAPTALSNIRVLLAEDGPDNQRLFSFHLRKAGAHVDVADNGRLAIELLEKLRAVNMPPHIILMDMQMPEMDGYDATRELRRLGCDLPIVALTAHAMAGDRDKCIRAGCTDYLSKPIDRTLLIHTVARLTEKRRAAA